MTRIIGSTYEIVEQLGAGGGGIVYLANHIRLNKQVVLKADRRKITTPPALLRREVDVLKDLKHPYIPQVYDFFSEGETVYTAMDYIDGTSLDKALKEYGRFSQPQVISWARQLLQALDYLHSPTHGSPPRGYVHSDIKPANLMLRPNGDICLIDFNISLALGEESVIGASAGYASPEHYGLDFSLYSSLTETQADGTVVMRDETETLTMPQTNRRIRPDIRSDIYSTGATLYHLLSGRKPAKSALEVTPLTEREASPQIARIIAKAMEPNAALRYQTAAEMLWDLEHLHVNDLRMKRYRRMVKATAVGLLAAFILGGAMTFTGLRQMEQIQARERAAAELAERTLTLITESESAYRRGDIPAAISASTEALQADIGPYTASAQLVLTEALGVYQLSDGFRSSRTLQLPGTLIKAALSPGGTRAALVTLGQVRIFDTQSGAELAVLHLERSALADVVFSGEDVLFYAGEGGAGAYDLVAGCTLWSGTHATGLALSKDGGTLAAVYKDEAGAVLYNAASGEIVHSVSFGTQHQDGTTNDIYADTESEIFSLSCSGRFLAVSFSDGGLTIFDTQDDNNNLTVFETSEYTHFEGGFYGDYLAFSASNATESVFAVVDAERQTQTIGFSAPDVFHVRTDEAGICLALGNTLVQIDPESGEQTEAAYTSDNITAYRRDGEYTAVLRESGALSFFDSGAREIETLDVGCCDFICLGGRYALAAGRDSSLAQVLRLENHSDAQLRNYDGAYPHSEARIGKEGTLMLFSYESFQLYALNGSLLAEEKFPDAGQIYDQQFLREEGVLEVTYYDGTVRRYATSNGAPLSERQTVPPDKSLDEEFQTSRLRIVAPLHDSATIYAQESGKVIRRIQNPADRYSLMKRNIT